MDTLTHALSGVVVGRLLVPGGAAAQSFHPTVWQAMAAGSLAAAFPDIDFVLGYVSELTYLRGHRGVTHSLVLLPAWGLLVAWLSARVLPRSGEQAPGWRAFYGIACAGIFIHILGDLITQFGTMIFAPFSDRRFALGTTFIIDLVFSGILVAGIAGSVLFRGSRAPAALSLAAVAAWVGVGWQGRGEAIAAARDYAAAHGIRAVQIDAAPRPASPFNWTAIVFDGERYHYSHLNTRRQTPLEAGPDDGLIRRLSAPYQPVGVAEWSVAPRFGSGPAAPVARSVWESEAFGFFRWFAMFPALDHADEHCAWFQDLRFLVPGREHIPFRYGLCREAGVPAAAGTGWQLYVLEGGGRRLLTSR